MDSIVIVGAGTFGGSLAWWLARDGVEVTLVDQFEPGDRRATSGGETRLIRCGHGDDAFYTASARRARTLWRELEAESGTDVLIECGLVWFARSTDGWEAASEATMRRTGHPRRAPGVDEGERLFPSFRGDDLEFLVHEPEAGVLRAQLATQTLGRQAEAHGARVVRGRAAAEGERVVVGGGTFEADAVVWACGGWLAGLFPGPRERDDAPGPVLPRRRRAVVARSRLGRLRRRRLRHRRPRRARGQGRARLRGPAARLPTTTSRPPAPTTRRWIREYFSRRFPALADAPLKSSTSCRYELGPDSNFIAASHPEHPSVWLLGGGSGHGFKHGPAIAEHLATALRGGEPMPERFKLGEREAGRSMRTAGSNPGEAGP